MGLDLYIPYNFLLKLNIFHDFFYRKKIKQNCAYIAKNKKKVLKKLRNKDVLKVVFYVYDSSKWKCQTIYDEMVMHSRFNPIVVVTKNAAQNLDNPSYQSKEDVLETFVQLSQGLKGMILSLTACLSAPVKTLWICLTELAESGSFFRSPLLSSRPLSRKLL